MKVDTKIFNTWAFFHFTFIICVCSYSAYDKYCKFYKVTESPLINKVNTALFVNKPLLYYGKFTGTAIGYGFFAPNIKSGGMILGDCDGGKIGPNFKNFEALMRFSVLETRITDYLINTTDTDTADLSGRSLKGKYYGLLFKSIAVKVYDQNHCLQDTAYLSYNIFQFPTLEAYRHGYRNYSLLKMKEVRLIKQAK